jgi:DNA-binding MarR family transcriptional regulator
MREESPEGQPILALHAEILRFVRLLKSSSAHDAVPDQSSLLLLWPLLHIGPMRLRDLAESKGVDSSTASRQAAQLVRAGMIRRDPDPGDGRAALLGLTDKGRHFCEHLLDARRRAIEEALRDWPSERISALADMLGELNQAIEAHQRSMHAVISQETQ